MSDKEYHTSAYIGWNKNKTAGIIMFWIGIVFLVIGVISIVVSSLSSGSSGMEEGLQIVAGIAAFVACIICCFCIIIGAILYFFGKSQAKKAKNQNSPLV